MTARQSWTVSGPVTTKALVRISNANGSATSERRLYCRLGLVRYHTPTTALEASARGVTSGDFNGDGKKDLAVTNYNANTVSILIGNGGGTFQAKVDDATGIEPDQIAVGDFNGDGKQDLAVANNDRTR